MPRWLVCDIREDTFIPTSLLACCSSLLLSLACVRPIYNLVILQ